MSKGFSFDALVNVVYPFNRTALASTNLNTLTRTEHVGVYWQGLNNLATIANNYPVRLAGSLEVLPGPMSDGVGAVQRYTVFTNGDTYTRGVYGNTASVWQKLISNVDIFKAVYPIGITVCFAVDADPNVTFPGTTWTRITDNKQVRPSENGAAVGTTGGADNYSLLAGNMPSHTHTINHKHANAISATSGDHSHGIPALGAGSAYSIGMYGIENKGITHLPSTVGGLHQHVVDIPQFTGSSGSTGSATAFSTSGAWRKYGIWQRTA